MSLHGAVSYYKVLCQSPVLKEWSLNGHSGHYLFQLTLPIHIQHNVGTERQLKHGFCDKNQHGLQLTTIHTHPQFNIGRKVHQCVFKVHFLVIKTV